MEGVKETKTKGGKETKKEGGKRLERERDVEGGKGMSSEERR